MKNKNVFPSHYSYSTRGTYANSMQKQHPAHPVAPFARFLDPEEGLDTCLEEMNRPAVSFLCQLSHKVSCLAFTGKMSFKSYQLGRRRWKLGIMNLRLLLL